MSIFSVQLFVCIFFQFDGFMEHLGLILGVLTHFFQVFYFDQFLVELELEVLDLMLEVQMRLLS